MGIGTLRRYHEVRRPAGYTPAPQESAVPEAPKAPEEVKEEKAQARKRKPAEPAEEQ